MSRRTNQQWQALIEDQAQSGQSAAEYCRQHGINAKYFSTRKQQFQRSKVNASGFVPARIAPASHSIDVSVGSATIKIPSNQPAAWLAEFVKALV